mmetsp:Transcript_48714/g.104266  ORF Transcript_48714/g.104266 Transcript_48714/m.104266 type:complete len:215 (+) Transcript_48714:877-1521(+)
MRASVMPIPADCATTPGMLPLRRSGVGISVTSPTGRPSSNALALSQADHIDADSAAARAPAPPHAAASRDNAARRSPLNALAAAALRSASMAVSGSGKAKSSVSDTMGLSAEAPQQLPLRSTKVRRAKYPEPSTSLRERGGNCNAVMKTPWDPAECSSWGHHSPKFCTSRPSGSRTERRHNDTRNIPVKHKPAAAVQLPLLVANCAAPKPSRAH